MEAEAEAHERQRQLLKAQAEAAEEAERQRQQQIQQQQQEQQQQQQLSKSGSNKHVRFEDTNEDEEMKEEGQYAVCIGQQVKANSSTWSTLASRLMPMADGTHIFASFFSVQIECQRRIILP